MKQETKLVNKVKRLIRKAGAPRWLHHYGPKKYEFFEHALALIVKQECRLSYRRVTRLFRGLGFSCPCPSALCMSLKRIPLYLWQKILAATTTKPNLVAIDGTGMSRPLPSPYYYKRIDRPYPVEIPLKLSIAVDTRKKSIVSLRFRAKKAHDIKDAKYLIKRIYPKKIVADKGYDANWLHKYCLERGIKTCIPIRDYGKTKHPNTLRKKLADKISQKTYGRREMIEAVFSAMKRKFGPSVSSVKFSAQRAEMYCRAIAHNIISYYFGLFEQSRTHSKALYTNL